MRILILGGSGMIGHRIWATLSQSHEVFGTLRRVELGPLQDLVNPKNAILNVDVLEDGAVEKVLSDIRPEVVINCIGLVKHLAASRDYVLTIKLNSLFPHKLAKACQSRNIRMIHFSTDCVFDGQKGMYREDDDTTATDMYGKSKALGEVSYLDNVLTIRTSTIGREVFPHGGLVEWFLSESGKTIKGYKNAIFSGFPTHTLAKILNEKVLNQPRLSGLLHIASEPIDKFTLLNLVKKEMNVNIEITKDEHFKLDRTLNGNKFLELTQFKAEPWKTMIQDINVDSEFYKKLSRSKHV